MIINPSKYKKKTVVISLGMLGHFYIIIEENTWNYNLTLLSLLSKNEYD